MIIGFRCPGIVYSDWRFVNLAVCRRGLVQFISNFCYVFYSGDGAKNSFFIIYG